MSPPPLGVVLLPAPQAAAAVRARAVTNGRAARGRSTMAGSWRPGAGLGRQGGGTIPCVVLAHPRLRVAGFQKSELAPAGKIFVALGAGAVVPVVEGMGAVLAVA